MKSSRQDTAVLNLRDMPRDLIASLKAVAALNHQPLKSYVTEILNKHIEDLQRRGMLPRGKST